MQLKKKVMIWAVAAVVLCSAMVPLPGKAAGIPITATTENNAVVSYDKAEKKDLTLAVTNHTENEISNISVTPALNENSDGWPFEISQQDYTQRMEQMAAGETKNLVFPFKAREDVTKEYYQLKFKIQFDMPDAKDNLVEQIIYVKTTPNVAQEQEKPEEQQKPEEQPKPSEPQTTEPEKPQSEVTKADDAGSSGGDAGGQISNGAVFASGGGKTASASLPRVIVTGFETNPGSVKAGTNFKLIVHVKNTSKNTAVSNMLFDIQTPSSGTEAAAEAPAFLPVSGSSSIYLDRIGAGETRDISIDLNSRADLVQKPYSVQMSMKYEDSSQTQLESSSTMAIPVQQPPRFEFSKIELSPEKVAVGEDTNLSGSLYNTGRIKLYNVKVKIVSTEIGENEAFIGNIDPGGTGAIDLMLTAKKQTKGMQQFKMMITYEDASGNESSAEELFSLEITPEENVVADTEAVEMEQQSFPIIPLTAGGVAVLLVGVAAVGIGKKKKKMNTAEEEELFDEFMGSSEDEH